MQLVDWRDLSDKTSGPDGRAALEANRDAWKHAESEHFIYHFRDEKNAETVYVHAEAYYAWIKQMFGVMGDSDSPKCQVYVFDDKALWTEFNKQPGTERLPGVEAYTNGTELFLYREPFYLEPQRVLAHEITHVVLHRFVKGTVPLFLNEGFAEFMGSRALALQTGGNEYAFRTLKMVPDERFIHLQELADMRTYPPDKETFYRESEFLARYLLLNYDPKKFYELIRGMALGQTLDSLLKSLYDMDLEKFEMKFHTYATVSSQK